MDAAFGRGCTHCELGVPVEKINSWAGFINLCLECVLLWFPGRAVDWWEAHHAPFRDHVTNAIKRANENAGKQAVSAILLGG